MRSRKGRKEEDINENCVFMHAKDRSVREAEQVATAAELNMAMKPYSFLYIRSKKNEGLCLEAQSSKSILMGKM